MQITEVKVFPVKEEKLKAFVSIIFDRCFMINDIKIIQGKDGLFISMPSRRKKNGEFKDVAHPLNNETRRVIEGEVLTAYERVLAERGETMPAPPVPRVAAAARAEGLIGRAEGPIGRAEGPIGRVEGPIGGAEGPIDAAEGPESASPGLEGGLTASERAPAAPESGAADAARQDGRPAAEGKSLEEVAEMHLRDSFWTS
jgi:stage V sporulation protein G